MELKDIMNSPMLWVMSSFMIINLFLMALMFLRLCFKNAEKLGIPKEECITGMRSAIFTAIGPAFAPVIVLIALMAVLGGPTAWMRMNDIGAARTELAMVTLAAGVAGVDPQNAANFGLKGYSYALWGMALNNLGWMFFTLILTHRMSDVVAKLNTKYDPAWIKYLTAGATIGLFAFLLSPRLVMPFKASSWCAAIVSAIVMMIVSKVFAKHQRLQELALGIAMVAGMYVTVAVFG